MRGDTRSLIHGIINLIVPFFIYDLASLLVGAITAANYNPWLAGFLAHDPSAVAALFV